MSGGFGLIIGGQDVARYSEAQIRDAGLCAARAEMQAALYWARRASSSQPWVPLDWTTWLLMAKAGVPCELIAYVCEVDPRRLRKRLLAATALMLFAPYAARIEVLMRAMPRFGVPRVTVLRPTR